MLELQYLFYTISCLFWPFTPTVECYFTPWLIGNVELNRINFNILYVQIVEFLIPLLDDKFPLIRSISCWTLSRFSKYIVQVWLNFCYTSYFPATSVFTSGLMQTFIFLRLIKMNNNLYFGAALPSV